MGFHAIFLKKPIKDVIIQFTGRIFDGHLLFIHKNEEFPMKTSNLFYSQTNETTSFTINPLQKVIDEDLYKLSFEE